MTTQREFKSASVTLDRVTRERADRLSGALQSDLSKLVRLGIQNLDQEQEYIRDLVRNAVWKLIAALEPDEGYDPEEDTRYEEAIQELTDLIGSIYIAEGIAEAIAMLRK